MTGSNSRIDGEHPADSLPSTTLISRNEQWLPKVFESTSKGLGLSPQLRRRINPEPILIHLDEPLLYRMVQPLVLTRPATVSRQLVQLGGPEVLVSDPAQVAIASWGKTYQAVPILREVMQAVSSLLKAHQKGELANPQVVLRALPVLSMCNFFPEEEVFRNDLASILGCASPDVPGLIRSYKTAALLADNPRVSAIDRRILSDPIWSVWVQGFIQEGNAIIKLSRPVTQWEFSQSEVDDSSLSSICQWLFRKE